MDALVRELDACRQSAAKHASYTEANEAVTQDALITPILVALGWDPRNPEVTRREQSLSGGNHVVDYVCEIGARPHNKTVLLVEAKRARADLSQPKVRDQALSYAAREGVQWVLTTNGIEWRLYNYFGRVPAAEQLFLKGSIKGQVEDVAQMLRLISRDSFLSDPMALERLWDEHVARRSVYRAVLSANSEPALPAEVRQWLESASGLKDELARGTDGLVLTPDYPDSLPTAVWVVDDDRTAERKTGSPALPLAAEPSATPPSADPDLLRLFTAGILTSGTMLRGTYRGHQVNAQLLDATGSVKVNGVVYPSLNQAMNVARKAIKPDANSESAWRWWKVVNGSTAPESLADLRARLAQNQGSR
ncbi:hypothetical protein AB0O76_02760 [Streptomyces sp. NPDC086554]|uniref:hypothetical protein n=1 Tax=Streptomyces sp. NPDC086554 TaxID=3154864 RepID=UPI0034493FD0